MSKRRLVFYVLLVVAILLVGGATFMALLAAKKPVERRKAPKLVPMVRVAQAKGGPLAMQVMGEGTVRPLRETSLVAEVSGKVVEVSPALVDGGAVQKGQVLCRIEPEDFELAVTLAEAQVKDAETKLKLAQEESAAARREWQRFQGRKGGEPPALVAKKPQLAAARASLQAARARLRQARLNLTRTRIVAPFNGRVYQKMVDLGQYLRAGAVVAGIFSSEAMEIVVSLDDRDLAWIKVPGLTPDTEAGDPATVMVHLAGREMHWPGRVMRALGKVDQKTRMVSVVVRVERPYSRTPPLAPGLFARVEIKGRTLAQGALIPREAVRQGNVVWLIEKGGVLRFRRVKVARWQGDWAVISQGLSGGETVVTSLLEVVSDGMRVRPVAAAGEKSS